MPLPLPSLTFYRMPDQSPAGTLISDLLDAIYSGLVSTTDYRGTSLPSAHRWTITRQRPVIVTEAVDCAPPAGTPMTRSPRILYAGRIVNAGTMASPDTSAASVLQVGINKLGGAYSDWSAASPYGTGSWFGYWRAAPVGANAVATVVRCFISTETIFVQIIQAATTQYWIYAGATVEPYDADTTNSGETDNRLYGMHTSGGASAVSASFLSTNAAMWNHSTSGSSYHSGVFTPGAGTIIAGGRRRIQTFATAAAELQTPSGVYVGDIMEFGRSTATDTNAGNRMGTIRGIYSAGLVQSGRYLRSGATDLWHFVSVDTTVADDGIMLPAAA
mgnify:CR=1 FL=1